jgi:gluconolactonase
MNLCPVADGLIFPEGPVVLADGSVLVVEVLGGRLTRIDSDGTKTVVAQTGGGPNGAAMGPDGRCWITNNGGYASVQMNGMLLPSDAPLETPPGTIQAVDLATGAVETIYDSGPNAPLWGPNDLVFDAHGGFWFTDFGRNRGRVRTRGAVYYALADGSRIVEAIYPLDSPNGIGLSPEGSTLYVADTFPSQVLSFRLSAPGRVDRSAGHMPNGANIVGRAGPGEALDSLAVDSAGNICVASPGKGAILVFKPQGGEPERIPTPDFLTTNIAFGGSDLSTAYITLGAAGRLVTMSWPRPGLRLNYQEIR